MDWKKKFVNLINTTYTKQTLFNYVYYQDPVCENVPFYILYDSKGNKLSEKYIIDDDTISSRFIHYPRAGTLNAPSKVSVTHLKNKSYSILRDYDKKCDYYIRESTLGWVSSNIQPNFIQYSKNNKILSVDVVDLKFVL